MAGLVDREPPVASCPPQRCGDSGDGYFYKLPRLGCLHYELAPMFLLWSEVVLGKKKQAKAREGGFLPFWSVLALCT